MKNFTRLFISLVISSFILNSCSDDKGDYFELNDWIKDHMDYYYYWNNFVPNKTNGVSEPEHFFYNMLEPTDIFSHISDDAQEYMNSVVGSSFTVGYSPAFIKLNELNDVFIIVRFVYPNTPAADAGIERGDVILKINGQQLTTTNYLDLYYADGTSGTVTFGELNEETKTILAGETISVSKAQIELNPVIYTKIFEHGGKKTGYIFYSRFVDGSSDQFVDALNDTLADMMTAGISELIIDLRYNPGGTISTAKAFANALAPRSATINEEVFVKFQYNEEYEQSIINEEGLDSEKLTINFNEGPVNLNLENVYFLTTESSASASELLINGLAPYLNVVQVGGPTYGKFYGAYVIPNEEFNYAIIPVTMKYANALGVTDFRDGLQPDHKAEEDLLHLTALGDSTDPLLGKALELITDEVTAIAKTPSFMPYTLLENPVELQKGNVLFRPKK